jgi:hypothetical protein
MPTQDQLAMLMDTVGLTITHTTTSIHPLRGQVSLLKARLTRRPSLPLSINMEAQRMINTKRRHGFQKIATSWYLHSRRASSAVTRSGARLIVHIFQSTDFPEDLRIDPIQPSLQAHILLILLNLAFHTLPSPGMLQHYLPMLPLP